MYKSLKAFRWNNELNALCDARICNKFAAQTVEGTWRVSA
jgi:hypothetical protein